MVLRDVVEKEKKNPPHYHQEKGAEHYKIEDAQDFNTVLLWCTATEQAEEGGGVQDSVSPETSEPY